MLSHPLALGTKILSVKGEQDQDDDNTVRRTGPNAIGRVIAADHIPHQGWSYGIEFSPSGVFVFIDQRDSIDDSSKYRRV